MSVYAGRRAKNRLALILAVLSMLLALLVILWILGMIVAKGVSGLSLAVFTEMTPPPGAFGGGLKNAIVGSLIITTLGMMIAIPIALFSGIYLAEYGKKSLLAKGTRFVNDILLSAPSIVIGLFVYAVYVAHVGQFSGAAGAMALALLALPVMVRTTEDMLMLVPNSLREAAFALGAPKWKVICLVSLSSAKPGIVTGILLALARISGETAPLLFTALSNQFWSTDLSKPMANLPVTIFRFAMSSFENWQDLAWAGVFLLSFGVLFLNMIVRLFFQKKQIV